MPDSERTTRREVLKKGTFVAPIILTFPSVASFARAGSDPKTDKKDKKDK